MKVFFDPRKTKTLYLAHVRAFLKNSNKINRVTVHEFLMADHVASWSSEYQLPSDDRSVKWFSATEYEYDRACIFFNWAFPLAVFDKIQRKFINFERNRCWELDESYALRYARHWFPKPEGTVWNRCDLDFMVMRGHEGYWMRQARPPA
jgi:hypothetical protein